MSLRYAFSLMAVVLLSLATYLLTVPLWRYQVVNNDLLARPFASAALQNWLRSPSGVTIEDDVASDHRSVCLVTEQPGATSYIAKAFLPPEGVDHMHLIAEVQAQGLVPGLRSWQSARLFVRSFDGERRYLSYWPKDAAQLTVSQDWQQRSLVLPLAEKVRVVQVVALNEARAGRFCLRGLRLEGLLERPALRLLRQGLWLIWAAVGAWVVVQVARSSASPISRAAVLFVALIILSLTGLPQPYYAGLVLPLETAIQQTLPVPPDDLTARDSLGGDALPSVAGDGSSPGADDPGTSKSSPSQTGVVDRAITWLRGWLSMDQAFHTVAFLALAFLVGHAYPSTPRWVLGVELLVGVLALETLQLLIITRSAQWEDGLAGGVGVLVGMGLSRIARGRRLTFGGPPASPSFDA